MSLINRVANWISQYNISGYGPRLYDAYGKQLWEETDLTIFPYFPFKFKGQAGYISDLNTGLVYCWHRYYDPKIARWISRDPIGHNDPLPATQHKLLSNLQTRPTNPRLRQQNTQPINQKRLTLLNRNHLQCPT